MNGSRRDQPWAPVKRSGDVSSLFVLFAAGPFLMPRLGVSLTAILFALVAVVALLGAVRWWVAARTDRARRVPWGACALALGLGAGAPLLLAAASLGAGSGIAGLYLGAAFSLLVAVAGATLVRSEVRGRRIERAVDALAPAVAIVGVAGWFVVIPGIRDGDPLLTAVFGLDLLALLLAATALVVQAGDAVRRAPLVRIVPGFLAITIADGLVSVESAGLLTVAPAIVAALWLMGALCLLATAFGLWSAGTLDEAGLAWLGGWFAAGLLLAFARQAYLVVDHRRGLDRERTTRQALTRRNEELEALTNLATTMTQTLEETPIVERGVDALRLAARASSAALHAPEAGRLRLRAAAGAWDTEHPWGTPHGALPAQPVLAHRGRRQIAHLPLVARGCELGVVTLMRGEGDPFDDDEIELLRLLADQLSVALQNARDYRERLEQAVRDPLTGIYNRRMFHEALGKEISRIHRYGSTAALVLFDLDDFKAINDTLGHGTGDDALRAVARVGQRLCRPSDFFARIGGEEFALLLPETSQVDALVVADRVRTAIARSRIVPDRKVTVSGGVACVPDDADDADELLRRADAALYWAKRHGKNMCAAVSEVVVDEDDEPATASAPLHAIVAAIDAQDFSTRDHSENVALYAMAIAQRLGLDGDRLVRLRRAALLHDVGKFTVDTEILAKPGPLTRAEYEQMQRHAAVGGTMLAHAGMPEEARWVRHHHERWDGGGYPCGLQADEIPLEARIIFAADSFEAMTSDRPYRSGMPVEDALAEVRRCAGTQFDPQVAEALVDLVEGGDIAVMALREPVETSLPRV
jgi:diguanylate cyclase (GGDEF)-like protein/putative nucleotidyltransferase with HDIG domain